MKSYEIIESYLAGNLSGEDLVAFEAELASDSELKNLVDNYDGVKSLSSGILEMELLEEVKNVTGNKGPAISGNENNWKFYILIAVMAILLAVMYFLNKQPFPTINKEEILIAYYEPPIDVNIKKSNAATDLEGFAKAKQDIGLNRPESAVNLLNEQLKEIDLSTLSLEQKELVGQKKIWLAHGYFKLGSYKKALALFEASKQQPNILENKECMIRLCQFFLKKIPRSDLDVVCLKKE